VKKSAFLIIALVLSGCNLSPLSPSNRPIIRNNGDVGDIKNNQQGMMLELANLKNRMDIMAQEIENIQNGFINHNNKNNGVQIFQGDGGLLVGISCIALLSIVAFNYRTKCEKYRKTAEIFGNKIKQMNDPKLKEELLVGALQNKVEEETLKMLK
jgi:hypothetical protein